MRKKFFAFALGAALMVSTLAGCGGGGETTTAAPETTTAAGGDTTTEADQGGATTDLSSVNAAVFYYTYSDVYISSVRTNLDNELNTLGVKYKDYDGNGNQTTQSEQVNTAITDGANLLIVNIVETSSDDAAQSIVDAAKEKDIPVIFFNREVSDDVVNSYEKCAFVGTDAAEAGHLQGQMIGEYLLKDYEKYDLNGDGEISYVMFKGQEGNKEAIFRTQYGVEDADKVLTEGGKKVLKFYDSKNTDKCLVDKNGLWSAQAANEYMTTILSEYSEANKNMVELIIANNDDMASGAITALESAGYNKEGATIIPVFGVDATDTAKELIADGVMAGTIKQDAEGMAKAISHLSSNAGSGKAIMDGTDSYNVDENVNKVRIAYAMFTGE